MITAVPDSYRMSPFCPVTVGNRMGNSIGSQSYTFDGIPSCWIETMSKEADVERELYVSLEEVNRGCVKKTRLTRTVAHADGLLRQEEKVYVVDVKPGCSDGTRVRFPREGDQLPNKIPADVVFVVRDRPHRLFKRNGNDIYYLAKITLQQALFGTRLDIPTLSTDRVYIDMSKEIVTPSTIRRIAGQGLPDPTKPFRRGDLYVLFDIEFPSYMSQKTRDKLGETLHECHGKLTALK